MAVLKSDNVADYDQLDSRVDEAVSAEQTRVWTNIQKTIGYERHDMRKLFRPIHDQYRAAERTGAKDTLATALRLGVSEADLRAHTPENRNTATFALESKAMDSTGTEISVDVAFDPTAGMILPLRAPEDMKDALLRNPTSTTGVVVTAKGGATFDRFTDAQAQDLAERYCSRVFPLSMLPRAFHSGGVSEANVQVALRIAGEMPAEVLSVFGQSTADVDRKIVSVKSRMAVSRYVDTLRGLDKGQEDYTVLDSQKTLIASDIATIYGTPPGSTPPPLTSAFGIELSKRFISWTKDDRNFAYKAVVEESDRIAKAINRYQKFHTVVVQIEHHLKEASHDILKDYLSGPPIVVDITKFTANQDPKLLADTLQKELDLKDERGYKEELAELEKKKKEVKEGKFALSGKDAVLAVYTKYFEDKQHLAPIEARRAAQELYGRNAIGRQEEVMQERLINNTQNVVKEEKLGVVVGEFGRELKELYKGSEQMFVNRIAESPVVGADRSWLRKRFGWIPYFGSSIAQPKWGSLQYPQLLVAFFALREAVNGKKIKNSAYIRGQLNDLRRMLTQKYTADIVRDADSAVLNEAEKRALESVPENTRRQEQIKLFLSGSIPETYAGDANAAIEYAVNKTGQARRVVAGALATGGTAVGTAAVKGGKAVRSVAVKTGAAGVSAVTKTAKTGVSAVKATGRWGINSVLGKGSIWNPITWPGKIIRTGVGIVDGTVNGARGWVSAKLNDKDTLF